MGSCLRPTPAAPDRNARHDYGTMSKGSTRRHRKARAILLANATHCHLCGQPARPGDPLVADHLIPRALGGLDVPWNYAAAHRSCNGRRGARLLGRTPTPTIAPLPEPTPETHPHFVWPWTPTTNSGTTTAASGDPGG